MKTPPGIRRRISILAVLGLGFLPPCMKAGELLPITASSGNIAGTLVGVATIGTSGDVNELMQIAVTKTGESYSVSAVAAGVRIAEEGWSESPRNSLSYKPYSKLLMGLGNIRNPWASVGTVEIDFATGSVVIHHLTEAGHGGDTQAAALAVNQSGRTIISVGFALLSLDIGQDFWDGATFLHQYFTGIGSITALAFSPEGVLYGWSSTHGLVRIDPGFSGYYNYSVPFVNAVGKGPGGVQMSSIEFTKDGTLIGVQPIGASLQRTAFYRIDPFTGSTAHIGDVNRRITALARSEDWQLPNHVALGDSFSSGEGAGSYYTATNRRAVNECRRSSHAWSTTTPGGQPDYQLDEALSHPLARPAFPACSGALIKDLFQSRDHAGEEWSDPPGPQLANVSSDVDFVTMTIGGNDMGFGDLILWCLVLDSCDQRPFPGTGSLTAEEWAMAWIARISRSGGGTLEEAYRAAAELGAAVYVLGYPHVLAPDNTNCALPASWQRSYLGRLLFELVPEGYPFQNSELQMFRRLGTALNEAIECSARRAGVHAVTTEVLENFHRHELCADGTPYFNGLKKIFHRFIPPCSGCELSLDWKETLHPNKRGQVAYAEALQEYVRSLEDPRVNPPAQACAAPAAAFAAMDTAPLPILGVLELSSDPPGRSRCNPAGAFSPGQVVHLRGVDFAPSTEVALKLMTRDGAFAQNLGTATTDSVGALLVDVSIPAGATTGIGAVLEASGTGATGEPLVLLGYLALVETTNADSDGDGVYDLCDNCYDIANADQGDTDLDFLGNTCDPCPLDPENDIDRDGLCAEVDLCPYIPLNPLAAEGICKEIIFADGFESGDTSAW